MRVHISKILSTCFFHSRRLRKLRPLIDTASTQRLAFILSRVDYCNAVLAGLPTSTFASYECRCPLCGRCYIAHTCQRYYEVTTLASDCLSDPLQTVCSYAWRSQRNKFFVSNGYNNTDLVIARTTSASFSNEDWIRYPSHQDKIWRQSFLCCWTAWVDCSFRRYKEHPPNKPSRHTFLYWRIRIKQFSRLYYVRRFSTIIRGCKMRHINGVYVLTYFTYQSVYKACLSHFTAKLYTSQYTRLVCPTSLPNCTPISIQALAG